MEELDFEARIKKLRDPALRERLVTEPCGNEERQRRFQQWDRIFPFGDPPQYEPDPETSIAAKAKRQGSAPAELAYDLMLEKGGRGILYRPTTNYADGDLAVVHEMHPDWPRRWRCACGCDVRRDRHGAHDQLLDSRPDAWPETRA